MLRSCSSFWRPSAVPTLAESALLETRVSEIEFFAKPRSATDMSPIAARDSRRDTPRVPRLADRRFAEYIDGDGPRGRVRGRDRQRDVADEHAAGIEDRVAGIRRGEARAGRKLHERGGGREAAGRRLAFD